MFMKHCVWLPFGVLNLIATVLFFGKIMDLLQIILIIIHITSTLSRRRHPISASDESIENLLYYKDCQLKTTTSTQKPAMVMKLRETPPVKPAYDCPYPKMCCSLSCNNDCGGSNSMNNILRDGGPMMGGMNGRYGMGGMPDMGDMGMPNMGMDAAPPFQHRQQPEPKRKKKVKPTDPLPPIGARREFGFTKDKIKGLISKDADIRKILKDLVRVTMKKVDLVEMLNTKKAIQANINARRTRAEGSQSSADDLE